MMCCKFRFRLSLSEDGPVTVSHQALDTERRASQMERRRCSGVRIRVGETRQNAKEGRLGLLFAGWMETRTCGRVDGMDGATANRHQPRRKNGRAAKVRQLRRFAWQVSVSGWYELRTSNELTSFFVSLGRLVLSCPRSGLVWSDLSGSGLRKSVSTA